MINRLIRLVVYDKPFRNRSKVTQKRSEKIIKGIKMLHLKILNAKESNKGETEEQQQKP